MRIIFSKNRAAQLDLLLRSLERHSPEEETAILWYATTDRFLRGYLTMRSYAPNAMTTSDEFDANLRLALARAGRYVTFFCDDDVVMRPIPDMSLFLADDRVLTFSWRLSSAESTWEWVPLPRTDHGYPGSIDGHTFRTRDIEAMIANDHIANPTILETALARECERFAVRRPLMAAWHEQLLVSVPVNRVSELSGCPYGERHPQSAADLNDRFLAGGRIDLDQLDFSDVRACHHELEYVWR